MVDRKIDGIEEDALEIISDEVAPEKKKLLGPEIHEIARDEKFYSNIINYLTGLNVDEKESKELWERILIHKYLISERLGRNIGIRVAALDFFLNIEKRLERVTFRDIEEMKKVYTEAEYDSLTRTFRKDVLFRKAAKLLEAAKKKKNDLSLIFADLDDFKRYNDSLGHLAGDAVLYEVAKILREFSENVFRFGGDEFILLEEVPREKALEITMAIRKKMEEKNFSKKNFDRGIGISFGVASYPEDGKTLDELLKFADGNLYEWKKKKNLF